MHLDSGMGVGLILFSLIFSNNKIGCDNCQTHKKAYPHHVPPNRFLKTLTTTEFKKLLCAVNLRQTLHLIGTKNL